MTDWGLCDACKRIALCPLGVNYEHHTNYQDFETSKRSGCIICNWLWYKHSPPQDHTSLQGFASFAHRFVDDFQLYIVCPWARTIDHYVRSIPEEIGEHDVPSQDTPWCRMDPTMGGDNTLRQIKGWLSECKERHERCRVPNGSPFFPTRVIDVDNIDKGIVKLVNREDIEPDIHHTTGSFPGYWTLSHLWGDPDQILQLRGKHETRFREGLPMSDLPKTFSDAMWVVHRLGYRYIWIDSLCIFQDSPKDWEKEAATMSSVYQNSFCNIAAHGASFDSSRGLLGDRFLEPRLLFPVSINVRGSDGYWRWTMMNRQIWQDEIEKSPLNSRGWVLQERLLAPRAVLFGKSQVYWECIKKEYCEADPEDRLHILTGDPTTPFESSFRSTHKRCQHVALSKGYDEDDEGLEKPVIMKRAEERLSRSWREIVTIYNTRSLTKESDVLVAISGVAKLFQEAILDDYLAGLWRKTLHRDLAWYPHGSRVRRNRESAPSWSWASVMSEFGPHWPGEFRDSMSCIELRNVRIEPTIIGGRRMGLLASAELEIACCLLKCRWKKIEGRGHDLPHFEVSIEETLQFETAYCRWDDKDMIDIPQTGESYCIPICHQENAGWDEYHFLLLKNVSGRRFVRLGLLEIVDTVGIDSFPVNTEITLI